MVARSSRWGKNGERLLHGVGGFLWRGWKYFGTRQQCWLHRTVNGSSKCYGIVCSKMVHFMLCEFHFLSILFTFLDCLFCDPLTLLSIKSPKRPIFKMQMSHLHCQELVNHWVWGVAQAPAFFKPPTWFWCIRRFATGRTSSFPPFYLETVPSSPARSPSFPLYWVFCNSKTLASKGKRKVLELQWSIQKTAPK